MLTQSQANARLIGGSSSGAILGLSKYRNRYQEWLRCTGQEEPDDLSQNIHIHTGNLLEPIIAELIGGFETGFEQEIHSDYPYISRNVDGLSSDRRVVHEIKTADTWMRKQFDDGPISMYNAQINHYALWPEVTDMKLHVLFVPTEMKQMFFDVKFTHEQLVNICKSLELVTFDCKPDILLQDYMLEQYKAFWQHVTDGTPPPAQNMDELSSMFMQSESGTIPATDVDLRAISKINELKSQKKIIEEEIKQEQFVICNHLGENEQMIYNGKKVATWKIQESKRVDTQRLKDDGLYEKYCKISKNRVFRG